MTNSIQSGKRRVIVNALAAVTIFVFGLAIGARIAHRFDETYVTKRFVSDRMAECSYSDRLFSLSRETGNQELIQLLSTDIAQCNRLITTFPHKIAARDQRIADRIAAAYEKTN